MHSALTREVDEGGDPAYTGIFGIRKLTGVPAAKELLTAHVEVLPRLPVELGQGLLADEFADSGLLLFGSCGHCLGFASWTHCGIAPTVGLAVGRRAAGLMRESP